MHFLWILWFFISGVNCIYFRQLHSSTQNTGKLNASHHSNSKTQTTTVALLCKLDAASGIVSYTNGLSPEMICIQSMIIIIKLTAAWDLPLRGPRYSPCSKCASVLENYRVAQWYCTLTIVGAGGADGWLG